MPEWQMKASKPAAIDKQEATIRDRARRFLSEFDRQTGISMSDHVQEVMLNLFLRYAAPLANEASKPAPKYDPCDPGNWRDGDDAMGNAAPSVEQDERGAFEAHIRNECDDAGYADMILRTNAHGFYHVTRIQGAWEGWQARAASTSANVAQGAEAVAYIDPNDLELLREYGTVSAELHATPGNVNTKALYFAAPPTQTALNILSDLAAVKRYSLDHHISGKGRTSTTLNVPNELLDRIDALLQRPVTGDPADDAADDAASGEPADDAAEQA
jgi:hypothetical protein